ncbi:hypothetical protein [Streptomyces caniscabiei]|uniref:hypothetical protein n=1 Tax=Streptomyces caniscabiei TaxID=2746961 RepID=UPI0015C50376|nr:hypothetical protein [Streptomyces caniscabiei]MDX3733482.1 hypothetical protein [Streptomyces caniscabiei]
MEVADRRPEIMAAKAVGPAVKFVVRVVEEPGFEVPQRPKTRDGFVPKFAVELNVMIMLAGCVDDLELAGKVQCESGQARECVRPVLEEKTVSIGCIRGSEALRAEAYEPGPHLVQTKLGEGLLCRAQLVSKPLLRWSMGSLLDIPVLRGLDGIACLAAIFSTDQSRRRDQGWLQSLGRDAFGAGLMELLADQVRVLGPYHPDTFATRHYLADRRGEAGDRAGAVAAYEELLSDQLRELGPSHPETATIREHLAYWNERGAEGDAPLRPVDDQDQQEEAPWPDRYPIMSIRDQRHRQHGRRLHLQ